MNDLDQARLKIINRAIFAVSVLSFICIASLCATLFWKNYADPAVLTAIITLTGTLTGALTTIMVLPRPKDQPPDMTITSPPQTVAITQPHPESEIKA